MKSLDKIAIECGTDKSSLFNNYCLDYERFLPFNREDKLTILEIGVHRGSSLRMWSEFYPNSLVIGVDITDKLCKLSKEDKNIKVVIGDQSNKSDLERVCKMYGPFDLVIDDGSHFTTHQLVSFDYLINHVKHDGVYIVEDLITSYWSKYIKDNFSMVDYLKNLVDDLNHKGAWREKELPRLREKQESLYQRRYNFKAMVFIRCSCLIFI